MFRSGPALRYLRSGEAGHRILNNSLLSEIDNAKSHQRTR